MHQTLTKKISICLATILIIIVTCTSCKADTYIKVKDYLTILANKSGISLSEDINDNLDELIKWGVVISNEEEKLEEKLNYGYLSLTIQRLLEKDNKEIINLGILDENKKDNEYVKKEELDVVIEKLINYLNHKEEKTLFEAEYTKEIKEQSDELIDGDLLRIDEDIYKYEDGNLKEATFEEIFSKLEIADSSYINFEEAIITSGEGDLNYSNEKFNLLASGSSFEKDGFKISYSVSRNGIKVHVKKEKNGINLYGDLEVYNVKPTFKWLYEKGNIANSFFTLKVNTASDFGVSIGKYSKSYLNFENLDSSSFLSKLKSSFKKESDVLEKSIKICSIKASIGEIPTLNLNLELYLNIYVSGKMELKFKNDNLFGYEAKNGNFRIIYEHDDDVDAIIGGSSKASVGLNLNVSLANFILMDAEINAGPKAELKSTIHLYDDEGKKESQNSDLAYSALIDISKNNPNVYVCGDVSLYWLLELELNTSKTILNKYGLYRYYDLSNENNQIFNNLHHIENGHFVEKCTRKDKNVVGTFEPVTSNKIVLNSYAEVISVNEIFEINVLSLPDGINIEDLKISVNDSSVLSINGFNIKGLKPGVSKVEVSSSDNKYISYINILVSSE